MTEKPIAHHFGYKYHSPFGHDADVLRYDAGPWNGQHPHAVVAFYTEAQLDAYTAELRAECERLRSAALLAAETFERYEALPRAAADEIEALRAENERLRMELEHEEQRVADMMDAVNRVGHEIERLRADAERYRWLREALESDDINALSAITSQLAPESADGFDAAIDAAMEATNAG